MSVFDELDPYADDAEQRLVQMEKRLQKLERYYVEVGAQNRELSAAADRFMRVSRSSLFSPNLLVRAFTVYGYYLLAGFIIAVPLVGCYLMLVLVLALGAN